MPLKYAAYSVMGWDKRAMMAPMKNLGVAARFCSTQLYIIVAPVKQHSMLMI